MCGITGWVDFGRDLRNERAAIESMTATMTPRGPDAGGIWCSEHAAIGHRRLSVIDLPCEIGIAWNTPVGRWLYSFSALKDGVRYRAATPSRMDRCSSSEPSRAWKMRRK